MLKEFYPQSEQETLHLGETFGRLLAGKTVILLSGDLGTGKTTFTKGLAKGLSVPSKYYITSPTYTIVNEYPGRIKLFHVDLYRLETALELEYIGIEEILKQEAVVAVEWPEILLDTDFVFDFQLKFRFDRHFNRKISVYPTGQATSNLLKGLLL